MQCRFDVIPHVIPKPPGELLNSGNHLQPTWPSIVADQDGPFRFQHAADFAQDSVVAELPEGRRIEGGRRGVVVGRAVVAGGEVFHEDQRGEEFADLVGVLGVRLDVLLDGRPLAPPVALDELFRRVGL